MIQFHLLLRTNRRSFEAKAAEETYVDTNRQTDNGRLVVDADLRLRITNSDTRPDPGLKANAQTDPGVRSARALGSANYAYITGKNSADD
jgi:hypothetical protein